MLQNITITLLVLLFPIGVIAQTNLVPNHSFELLENDNIGVSPTSGGQIDHLLNWEQFKTSDLISSDPNFWTVDWKNAQNYDGMSPGNAQMLAHTGDKFIGMGSCEGAQAKLLDQVEEMEWVTVSFWYSPRGKTDTEINAYITVNQSPNSALDDCLNPNIAPGAHFNVEINANGPDAIHSPGQWYFYQSQPQLVTGNNVYEWFLIKGRDVGGMFESHEYFFIDDVSVEKFDFCSHFCLPHGDVVLVHPTDGIQNSMIGNSIDQNFFATFQNAEEVRFRVFTPDEGCLIYEWYSYDVNGLVDIGFTDFAISWNGNTNVTNSCHTGTSDVIYPDVYVIDLEAKSCSGVDFHYTGSLTVVNIESPPATPYPETRNKHLGDCCPTDACFQNQTWTTYFREDVDNTISAGSNLCSGPTGNCVVGVGGDVRFYAGQSIILDPGFIVTSNGHYIGEIAACGAAPLRMGIDSTQEHIRQIREARLFNTAPDMAIKLDEIIIQPNPSNGIFNVELKNFNVSAIESVEIYNMEGRIEQIISKEAISNRLNIDLSNSNGGVYLLKVRVDNGKVYAEKIVKMQ